MRKIFSILIVLGLVLGMTAVTAPASAQDLTCAKANSITLTDYCAGVSPVTYCVNFTLKSTMTEGVDTFWIEFPEGTTFGTTFGDTGDVRVGGINVHEDDIEVVGTTVKIVTPTTITASSGNPQFVVICVDKVKNPSTAGKTSLTVTAAQGCCDPFACWTAEYTILPAYSTYKLAIDFGPTYPGIAPGFIPPFKACGQDGTGLPWNTVPITGGFANNATLTVTYDTLGCAAPCATAAFWYTLTGPVGSTSYVSFNGTPRTHAIGPTTTLPVKQTLSNIALAANTTLTFELLLHFDMVGEFEICFFVECTIAQPCDDADKVVWDICLPFTVHQWKDAWNIVLQPKWNLISLPLVPFDTSVDAILAPFAAKDQIKAIWHYDRPANDWLGYPDQGLTDIEDGKAYWFRMLYAGDGAAYKAAKFPATLWVFGNARPMPPANPAVYDVYEGWNMVGFLPPWFGTPYVPNDQDNDEYLWNWFTYLNLPEYSAIYGWNAAVQNWDALIQPGATDLVVGKGYWISFGHDGTIEP